jgi:hypothetical protein
LRLVDRLKSVTAHLIQETTAILEAAPRRDRLRCDANSALQEHTCQAAAFGGTLGAAAVELGPHNPGSGGEGTAAEARQPPYV